MPNEPLAQRIENDFRYHPPTPEQVELYDRIRRSARAHALLLEELCPASRELSTALTYLESSVMHANAAIARNGGT